MPALNLQQSAPSPATWSGEMVRQRLVGAFEIERRMPGERRYNTTSAWPAEVVPTWQDKVHWTDARDRVLDGWERSSSASPIEVSMMEEAIDWLRWVPINERRALAAWAMATSGNRSVSAVMARRHLSRTTFYRLCKVAASRIADRLNRQGVQVR